MRKLWTEEWVDFKGKYYRLKQAKLYVKPTTPVPVYVASFGPKVAQIAGKYADGYRRLPSQCADSCCRTWCEADGA